MATAPVTLTAVYEPVEDGWVQASLVEWPAIITCGPTREEAHEMLHDAFREMLLSYTDQDATPPVEAVGPDTLDIEGGRWCVGREVAREPASAVVRAAP